MELAVNYSEYRRYNTPLEDELVKSWGAISQPGHVVVILASYLAFVLVAGPKYMSGRKPFALKNTLLAYNGVQIVWNVYMVYLYVWFMGSKSLSFWENVCYPLSAAQNFKPGTTLLITEAMRLYYINKIVDLMDTVFFILRKKNSQVSFLHLFHHVTMVSCSYFCVMVIRDTSLFRKSSIEPPSMSCSANVFVACLRDNEQEEISATIGTLNSVVHVIMYTYYLLAGIGPHMQKYLTWKKYLTSFQIGQFVVQLSILALLKYNNCACDPRFSMMWFFNIGAFLFLFVKFYIDSYSKRTKKE